jgi:hypothetical protein
MGGAGTSDKKPIDLDKELSPLKPFAPDHATVMREGKTDGKSQNTRSRSTIKISGRNDIFYSEEEASSKSIVGFAVQARSVDCRRPNLRPDGPASARIFIQQKKTDFRNGSHGTVGGKMQAI